MKKKIAQTMEGAIKLLEANYLLLNISCGTWPK
jgi:hypothetical protein